MKKNKILILLVFIMSLFVLPNSIKADYIGVVKGNKPKCELNGNATGKCLYANGNLNSIVPAVVWLDLGDEVIVYENDTVPTNDLNRCGDYYVKVRYNFPTAPTNYYYGYFCHADLKNSQESSLTDALREEFRNAGFPESYFEKLAELKTNHPNWNFRAINTGLDFNDAVLNETYGGRSLVQLSSSNNLAYLGTGHDSFDYLSNAFIAKDNVGGVDPWYIANYDTVAYYMDPRNFLIDMYIFQFQSLSNEGIISDDNLRNIIGSAYGTGSLVGYVNTFIQAGKESNVDPIYLAALSIQEVGTNYSTATNGAYNGHYNFYNIGATGGANPVIRGLDYAANGDASTNRPWNTPEKAIIGGAKWIYNNYVGYGQETSYFKRFNVIANYLANNGIADYYPNYQHQYMTNTMAPSSEAATSFRGYSKNELLDLNLNFYIPVYNNMPAKTSLPTNGGWPNNYLASITINNVKVANFNSEVENYDYYLDVNNPKINISAVAIDNNPRTKIYGLGEYTINQNQIIDIIVVAENGNQKTYRINVILTGQKDDTPVTPTPESIQNVINKTDIKNNDRFLSGIEIGSDIKLIKDKIQAQSSNIQVTTYNSNMQVKETGKVATGDKVKVVLNGEEKTYDVVIYGDISGDGEIDATDFVKLKKQLLGESKLNNLYLESANISKNANHDNDVNATDFVKLKKYLLGDKSSIIQ